MGGVDAPPSARRLVLRSASREGGSLKPGGGKSPPDRQRRSFAAPGFVVARSAAPSTKNFEEPKNSQSPLFTCNCQIPSLTTDNYSLFTITYYLLSGRLLAWREPDPYSKKLVPLSMAGAASRAEPEVT